MKMPIETIHDHTFVLQKNEWVWEARTTVSDDAILMRVDVSDPDSYEDPDFEKWMDALVDLLMNAGRRLVSKSHIGSEATITRVYDPED